MENDYKTLRDNQQERYNQFSSKYMFYAFSKEQFKDGMESLGLTDSSKDIKKIASAGNGAYILKSRVKEFNELLRGFNAELHDAISNDTGEPKGFIYSMFYYELANHEYCYSYDLEEVIEACGLTVAEVNEDEKLSSILNRARSQYMNDIDGCI